MSKTKSAPRTRRTWRDTPENQIRGFPSWPAPESLHPTESTIINALSGDESAQAIIQSYALCAFPYPTAVQA